MIPLRTTITPRERIGESRGHHALWPPEARSPAHSPPHKQTIVCSLTPAPLKKAMDPQRHIPHFALWERYRGGPHSARPPQMRSARRRAVRRLRQASVADVFDWNNRKYPAADARRNAHSRRWRPASAAPINRSPIPLSPSLSFASLDPAPPSLFLYPTSLFCPSLTIDFL